MSWLRSRFANPSKGKQAADLPAVVVDSEGLPQWTPAAGVSHEYGLVNEASDDDFERALKFFERNPNPEMPRFFASHIVESINDGEGIREWRIEVPTTRRFMGKVTSPEKGKDVCTVETRGSCKDTCLMSNLPIAAGMYDVRQSGVYYEVCIRKMKSVVAAGTACRPYPDFRLPGWHRLSVGFHLDDLRKFHDDSAGGMDYSIPTKKISRGDVIGCGLDFTTQAVFFTYNGLRLPDAFGGVYVPRSAYDIYAAIGVDGESDFDVNFGAAPFKWKEANEWSWRIEGQFAVRRNAGGSSGGGQAGVVDDELPSYNDALAGGASRRRRY